MRRTELTPKEEYLKLRKMTLTYRKLHDKAMRTNAYRLKNQIKEQKNEKIKKRLIKKEWTKVIKQPLCLYMNSNDLSLVSPLPDLNLEKSIYISTSSIKRHSSISMVEMEKQLNINQIEPLEIKKESIKNPPQAFLRKRYRSKYLNEDLKQKINNNGYYLRIHLNPIYWKNFKEYRPKPQDNSYIDQLTERKISRLSSLNVLKEKEKG